MNRRRLFEALWVMELIIGLLPAFAVLSASLLSYAFLVPILLPHLLTKSPSSTALRTILLLSGMVLGGIMGLTGIGLSLWPERLHRSPRLKRTAILLGCAGILAEALYTATDGPRAIASNAFSLWVVVGPLIVGGHCLYRVFSKPPRARSYTKV
jgi:hypothetical protein